jgi:hypothetical protein
MIPRAQKEFSPVSPIRSWPQVAQELRRRGIANIGAKRAIQIHDRAMAKLRKMLGVIQ